MNKFKQAIFNNKKLFKDYFTVIFGTGLGRCLSFITSLILARFLGAHGFGFFSVFFTVMTLVWQIPTIIDAIYVRYAKAEARDKKTEYIRTTFFMKGIIFILLLILAYPASLLLASYVFNKPELLFYLIAAIVSGAFLSLFTSLAGIYQAEERFYAFSILNVLFYGVIFFIVGGIALSGIKFSPLMVSWVYSVSALGAGCFGILYLYNRTKPLFPIHISVLYDMFHFGKWLLGENLIYITLQRLDVLFLVRLANYEELGIYSAAVRIAMFASLLTSSSSVIFMPRGCESFKSTSRLKSYFKESFIVMFGLAIFIIGLIIISPIIIKIFFGSQYVNCITAARILLLEAIFVVLYTPFSYLFYATGKTRQIFNLGITKLIITIGSLLLLVPVYGSTGAALSIAFSSFCGLIFVIIMSSKIIRDSHINFQLLENISQEVSL